MKKCIECKTTHKDEETKVYAQCPVLTDTGGFVGYESRCIDENRCPECGAITEEV